MVNNVTKFKCGDIIYDNEYNHYGVILGSEYVPVFIASQNEEVVEEFVGYAWYRQDSGHFYNLCVPAKYVEHVKNDLPEDFKFFYGLSDMLSHIRVDYTVIDDGDIKTGYNLPLIGVLESVCLIDAIDRSAYISKNVFAEHPEVFLNECEYAFKLQWENCEEADVVFYRVWDWLFVCCDVIISYFQLNVNTPRQITIKNKGGQKKMKKYFVVYNGKFMGGSTEVEGEREALSDRFNSISWKRWS